MCLNNITDINSNRPNRVRKGYKLYYSNDKDGYKFIVGTPIKARIWHNAENPYPNLYLNKMMHPEYGFHIIRSDAQSLKSIINKAREKHCILCEVEYSMPLRYGTQYGLECVTAEKMKVVRQVVDKNGRIRK